MTPAEMNSIFKKVWAPEHFAPETRPTHDFEPFMALFDPRPNLYSKELEFRARCRRLKLLPETLYRPQDFFDDDLHDEAARVAWAEREFLERCREMNLL